MWVEFHRAKKKNGRYDLNNPPVIFDFSESFPVAMKFDGDDLVFLYYNPEA